MTQYIAKSYGLNDTCWFDPGTQAELVSWTERGVRGIFKGWRKGASTMMEAMASEFVTKEETESDNMVVVDLGSNMVVDLGNVAPVGRLFTTASPVDTYWHGYRT